VASLFVFWHGFVCDSLSGGLGSRFHSFGCLSASELYGKHKIMDRRGFALFVVAMGLVGCSGDQLVAPIASEAASPLTVTTVKSLDDSTTTTDPYLVVEAEIVATIERWHTDWHDCLAVLQDCEPAVRFESVLAEPFMTEQMAELTELQVSGYVARPPGDPADLSLTIDGVVLARVDSAVARVRYCEVDGTTLVLPGGGSGSEDLVVRHGVFSRFHEAGLARGSDGGWRVTDRETKHQWPNGDGCDQ